MRISNSIWWKKSKNRRFARRVGHSWKRRLQWGKRPWEPLRQRNQLCMYANPGLLLWLMLRLWITNKKENKKIEMKTKIRDYESWKRDREEMSEHWPPPYMTRVWWGECELCKRKLGLKGLDEKECKEGARRERNERRKKRTNRRRRRRRKTKGFFKFSLMAGSWDSIHATFYGCSWERLEVYTF